MSRKSYKTKKKYSQKSKIYACLDIFQSHPAGQIGVFAQLILAPGAYCVFDNLGL